MGLMCCALLAWAGALLIRPDRGRWPVVGFALALTPMSVFVSSTVNQSGITLAFSLLLVAGAVARWMYGERGRMAVVAMSVGVPGLLLVRRDSALWVAILAVSLAPLALAGSWVRARLSVLDPCWWSIRQRGVAAVALLGVLLAAVMWVGPIVHRLLTSGEVEGNGSCWQGLGTMQVYLDHMIGTFGWIDTFVGCEMCTLITGVCFAVVLPGLVSGAGRPVVAEGVSLVALLATPVVFGMIIFTCFEGRYLLPIWVIVAVMAALAIGRSQFAAAAGDRLVTVLLTLWGALDVWSLLQNLRRYPVGYDGTWWFTLDALWEPPMMSNLVAVMLIAVASATSAFALSRVVRLLRPDDDRVGRRSTNQN